MYLITFATLFEKLLIAPTIEKGLPIVSLMLLPPILKNIETVDEHTLFSFVFIKSLDFKKGMGCYFEFQLVVY